MIRTAAIATTILGTASLTSLALNGGQAHAGVPAPGGVTTVTVTARPVFDINGVQDTVTMAGSAEFTSGPSVTIAGHPAVPLSISDEELTGYSPALGHVHMKLESPQDAWLIENSAARPFPAEEVMPFSYDITADCFPGEILTGQAADPGPAILRNSNITNFPPQNDVYQLVEPIELEDINDPGPVLATIQSFPLTVNSPA